MIVQLLREGTRRFRPAIGWAAFGLAMAAVWASALGVVEAEWVDGDELFLHIAPVGALLAVLLAHSGLRAHWAALISAGSGLLYVTQSLVRFIPPPWRAVQELARGAEWLLLRVAYGQGQPDLAPPAFPVWNESGLRLLTFGERLGSWADALMGGQTEQNPVAFLFVSGLLIWGGAAWAMWITVRRGRALLAMLPLGLILSMSTYLGDSPISYVIAFVSCVLLMLPILTLAWQERRWDQAGIDYSTEIRFDVWQVATLVAIVALLLAMIVPSVRIPRLVSTFWDLASRPLETIEDFMFRFLGNVEPVPQPELAVPGGEGDSFGPPDAALPRAHLLGGGAELNNQVVMVVCTDGPAPPPEELLYQEQLPAPPRHYWKGVTYDLYTGQRWTNGRNRAIEIPPHEPVLRSIVTPTLPLRQRFLFQVPHGYTLYAAAEAARVDQRVESRQRTEDDLVGLEGRLDDYVVYSEIPQASVRQLIEQAPTLALAAYPDEISDRYLSLPRLPDRVQSLALEIVADIESPYERALAIERYLRQFPYDLDVAPPPPGRDVVDYFLFDAQRGYCDYYGSAFVVLARAAGIPARLAIGYTMGAYDYDLGCYVVTEKNAHSWPEVYFGELGWIAFEPTAAYETLPRPRDPIQPTALNPSVQPPPTRTWDVRLREWWRRVRPTDRREMVRAVAGGATTIAAVLLLTQLIVRAVRDYRRRRLPPVQGIALCYAEMGRLGEKLGAVRHPRDTPAEYARVLAAAVQGRTARWPWSTQRLMPLQAEIAQDTTRLSQAYQRASYYPQSITPRERSRIDRLWQRLQGQLQQLAWISLDKSGK